MSTIYLMRVKSFGLIMAILAIVASQAFAAENGNGAVISSDALTLPAATTVMPGAVVTMPASSNVPPRRASEPGPYVDNDSFTALERDAYNIRNDPNTTIPGVTVAPIHSSTMTNPVVVYPTSARVYPAAPVYASSPVYYNRVMPSYGMGYSSMAAYSGLPRRASDPVPYPDNDSFTSFEKDIYNLRR